MGQGKKKLPKGLRVPFGEGISQGAVKSGSLTFRRKESLLQLSIKHIYQLLNGVWKPR